MLFLFFGLFCEPALTFPKTIDKPSMSMVSHKTIHSMAMVGLEKNIGKTIHTNGWDLKNHWKTIDTNGSNVKNHLKTIDYNGFFLAKTITIPSWSKFYHRSGLIQIVDNLLFRFSKTKHFQLVTEKASCLFSSQTICMEPVEFLRIAPPCFFHIFLAPQVL